jgi:hypothetical protein
MENERFIRSSVRFQLLESFIVCMSKQNILDVITECFVDSYLYCDYARIMWQNYTILCLLPCSKPYDKMNTLLY